MVSPRLVECKPFLEFLRPQQERSGKVLLHLVVVLAVELLARQVAGVAEGALRIALLLDELVGVRRIRLRALTFFLRLGMQPLEPRTRALHRIN